MAHAKVAVIHSTHEAALAALALVVMFSAGLAAGITLPHSSGAAGQLAVTSTVKPFVGVAFNNMSDAAWSAMYGPKSFRGVADNNMSDAAWVATYRIDTFEGVADDNMSDAAWVAMYGRESFLGVADNNMSDAAWEAWYGRK
jgi:hypothetical protein